jgi:catechol 2,3-dioxygenase
VADFPIIAIRSVELGVPDLEQAEGFYGDVWGLHVSARVEGALYLRSTGPDHHVLALRPHSKPEILSVSFRAKDAAALDQIAKCIVSANGTVLTPPGQNLEPDGGFVLKVATPEGYILRFHAGDRFLPEAETRPSLPFRLSHVNLNCRDIEATARFFQDALGFVQTDRSRAMSFLRCNSDHHAVVLADSGIDGLNHVAFMMPGWESVMLGSGRMIDNGFPIGWGVGRHGPGNNVFAYFVDPFGFVIEYTAEVLQVDDKYTPHGPDYWVWPKGRTDQWGIAPPKPESVKQAQLAIRFASTPAATSKHE